MEPDAPRPLAPPTVPGARPAHAGLPWNRKALAALACGIAGLVVPIVNILAIVLGALALQGLNRPEKREQGLACAVTGIVSGILGIFSSGVVVLTVFSLLQGFSSVQNLMQTPNLQFIHMQMQTMPSSDHVARLIVDRSFPAHLYVVEGGVQKGQLAPGRLALGGFDFSNYDFSPKAVQRLEAALDTVDTSAPWYRFGQCWFVRLPKRVNDAEAVAGWSLRRSGEVRVLFAGGAVEEDVDEARWDEIWAGDAAARATDALPAMEPPVFPMVEMLTP